MREVSETDRQMKHEANPRTIFCLETHSSSTIFFRIAQEKGSTLSGTFNLWQRNMHQNTIRNCDLQIFKIILYSKSGSQGKI